MSARTNSAGPGYHAYLIDVLDGIGVAPIEVEDETGYWDNRDFGLLQNEMSLWLRGLSEQLLEMSNSGEYSNIAISMPVDYVPCDPRHFTCCPLGYFEQDFYEKTLNGETDGKDFFLWWNRQQDALFFKNCATNLILSENNWLPPESDKESEIIAATLGCLEKAYGMNSGLDYPVPEWLELAGLSNDEALAEKLRKRFGETGNAELGYLRGNIRSNINGWRISRNGKMHFEMDEDGTNVWWDSDRTIHATTFSVQRKDGAVENSKALLEQVTHDEPGFVPLSLRDDKIVAAILHSQIEEDGESLWQTRLGVASGNELLMLSIYYISEADRGWATEVCASVSR